MEIDEHIHHLRREGNLLAEAAARSGPDAPVPTCPGWRMRDLVLHVGGVHRWAAAHVRDRRTELIGLNRPEDIEEHPPSDAALMDWFRAGHAELVAVLERADPDLTCVTFLAARSPLGFWARRQAHETGIHRADAESPSGAVTPFPPDLAADGIDELLVAFLTRPSGRLRRSGPRSLQVHADDLGADWLVRIGPERVEVTREAGPADCSVRGPASDLFLLLWNRRAADGAIQVGGDRGFLDLWREAVRIRWT